MKILVNASTAVVGGVAQVAATFIVNTIEKPSGHDFMYTVSSLVAEQIKSLIKTLPSQVVVISPTPAKLLGGRASRAAIRLLARTFRPDVVYSIASPSYVHFESTLEVARYTCGWFTHPNKLAYSTLSLAGVLRFRLQDFYTAWSLRHVRCFQVQTQVAAQGLARRLALRPEDVRVIPNCQNQIFSEAGQFAVPRDGLCGEAKIFVLAHPYPHKKLDIVPHVAAALMACGKTAKFVMTLPENNPQTLKILAAADQLHVRHMIENVGRVDLRECREWYGRCDLVFMPTVFETFSATYLEAMAMRRPIVATDLDFARDACGDAAEYYEPTNAAAAAAAIARLMDDKGRYKQLVQNGREQLLRFPTPQAKYEMELAWILEMAEKHAASRADGLSRH